MKSSEAKKKRVLIVSPHPDDAELGMGGTMISLKSKGHSVYLIDLTSGEPTPEGSVPRRRKESREADRILKIDKRISLGFRNRYLSDTKKERLALAEKIRLIKPDVIFCPHPIDAHPDHIAASKISETARFYAKYTKVTLKGSPHYVPVFFNYFCSHLRRIPEFTFLVDITSCFESKIEAVSCYRSQFI
ncbi:MAG: bacillithiol biosynthesis deacetylase BshB1, partial [Candidatus Omnitrophica bacterium]|nr:bacillithiol biosynthesis deacetylase BshB1 [Candidatus Omnitrophota bacterium]MBD3268745.1 bacillithiol biosynthesis deacetylase BshB1 [Candidatus Omnitrophota bacterium]